jgi:hypothetical protein
LSTVAEPTLIVFKGEDTSGIIAGSFIVPSTETTDAYLLLTGGESPLFLAPDGTLLVGPNYLIAVLDPTTQRVRAVDAALLAQNSYVKIICTIDPTTTAFTCTDGGVNNVFTVIFPTAGGASYLRLAASGAMPPDGFLTLNGGAAIIALAYP